LRESYQKLIFRPTLTVYCTTVSLNTTKVTIKILQGRAVTQIV